MDDIDKEIEEFFDTYYPLTKELKKAQKMGDNELIKENLLKTIDTAKSRGEVDLVSHLSKIIESYDLNGEFNFDPENIRSTAYRNNKPQDINKGSVLTLDSNRQHRDTRKWYNTWPFCNLPEIYNEDTFKIDPNDKDDSNKETFHEFMERWKREHNYL